MIIVDVTRTDSLVPWNFAVNPSAGEQSFGSYPRFYAPDPSYPAATGGAPYESYESITDSAGANALLVCRDISNPDEIMPMPHNSRQGVRILSDKWYVRRTRRLGNSESVATIAGTVVQQNVPLPAEEVDLTTTPSVRSDFQVQGLKFSITLPWFKRQVEYQNPLFVEGPEGGYLPSTDLRSNLGETFICMESWIVPLGLSQMSEAHPTNARYM